MPPARETRGGRRAGLGSPSMSSPASPILAACYRGDLSGAERLAGEREALDLMEAAALGRAERVGAILDEDPGAVDARSGDGFTPLHYAAFFAHGPETARELLA